MVDSHSILVALATYNEIENIPKLVNSIHELLPEVDIKVIDDNSPDGTGNWCKTFAKENPWFSVNERESKLGLGSALATAMHIAIESGYQALITLDADWSHPPEYLPSLLSKSSDSDVVIGSRYCTGGGIEGWPMHRRIISRVVNRVARLFLGIPVSDYSGNFRLYKTAALKNLPLDKLQAKGYAFIEEVLWYLHRNGCKISEVPFTFKERLEGNSKLNFKESLGLMKTLGRLFWMRLTATKLNDSTD